MNIVTDIDQLRIKSVDITDKIEAISIGTTLMVELVNRPAAAGLAANQLGFKVRALIIRQNAFPPIVILNPVITKQRGSQSHNEGCFSLPGVFVEVRRPMNIKVKGVNQYLKFVSYHLSGYDAAKMCHEIDHLDGKLITDFIVVREEIIPGAPK